MQKNNYIFFAWIVSIIATAGSLYFSEVKGFIPCELCWFQRIFMYPLTIFLGVAYFRNNKDIVYYVLPMSIIGGSISLYHYLLQKTHIFDKIQLCTVGVPCNGQYINWFGFITIPFLALTAFTLITSTLLVLHLKK